MTPAAIIRDASADGVRLTLSPAGTIKAAGDGAAVGRWLATVRAHKAAIIAQLRAAANDDGKAQASDAVSSRQPLTPMTAGEETAVRAWLDWIDETDAGIIADVLGRSAGDLSARAYFVGRAGEIRQPTGPDDDRRRCDQCANLAGRGCLAARRGEIRASRNHEPVGDMPRRCEGYAPGAEDHDRRPGRERWPDLMATRGDDAND